MNLSTLTNVQLLGATAGSYIPLNTFTQRPCRPSHHFANPALHGHRLCRKTHVFRPDSELCATVSSLFLLVGAGENHHGRRHAQSVRLHRRRRDISRLGGNGDPHQWHEYHFHHRRFGGDRHRRRHPAGAFLGDTGNANFNGVLTRFNYDSGPKTIVLSNLAAGRTYSVQLFALDDRHDGSAESTRQASFQQANNPADVWPRF